MDFDEMRGAMNRALGAEKLSRKYGPLMYLKCCRIWPCHLAYISYGGRCGICKQVPIVLEEDELLHD